jgi:hypothetical protein
MKALRRALSDFWHEQRVGTWGDGPALRESRATPAAAVNITEALSAAISGARACDSDVIQLGLVPKHSETKRRAETTIGRY